MKEKLLYNYRAYAQKLSSRVRQVGVFISNLAGIGTWEGSPSSDISQFFDSLIPNGVLQFNSILTLTTQNSCRPHMLRQSPSILTKLQSFCHISWVKGQCPQQKCPYFRCQPQEGSPSYLHFCLNWLQTWEFPQSSLSSWACSYISFISASVFIWPSLYYFCVSRVL